MFTQHLFNHLALLMAGQISRLISSRWAHGYEEHHSSCEDVYAARLGPLHLEVNHCFVLEHDDAYVGICLPTWHRLDNEWRRGRLHLGYQVCLGEEQVRDTGFCTFWSRPLLRRRSTQVPKSDYGKDCPLANDDYFSF